MNSYVLTEWLEGQLCAPIKVHGNYVKKDSDLNKISSTNRTAAHRSSRTVHRPPMRRVPVLAVMKTEN